MNKTTHLGLPLIMPAQAQKHVTVNEAFVKLDALFQLRLISTKIITPPSEPALGSSYFLSQHAAGEWAAHSGNIATFINGGWVYTKPSIGWKAWVEESGSYKVFDGFNWCDSAVAVKSTGSAVALVIDEIDHPIASGLSNLTSYFIPEDAVVVGVTGRVLDSIQGSGLTSWRLGVENYDNRYGSFLGLEKNSFVRGVTGSPLAYYEPTPLLLTAEGGNFLSGLIRLSIHYLHLSLPRAT